MMEKPSPILTAARDYIKHGWAVFPVPPGTKRSYEKAEDHEGRRWGASSDPETVDLLFRKWPDAGIGIACQESGLVVLDLDRKDGKDGVAWMQAQLARHGELPNTIEATTPSGGQHIYFKAPFDFDPKTCEGEIAPGVDVRGHGGFVVAPPSRKPNAGEYCWKNPPGLFDPAPLPEWLAALLPHRTALKIDTGLRIDTHERAGADEAADILRHIDPDAGGYDQWARVLMALHDHFDGSPQGLTIAEAWSSCGAKYRNGEVAAKWQSFTSGHGVGFGSVCELARQNGADLSNIARRHRLGVSKAHKEPSESKEKTDEALFCPATRWAGKVIPPREWVVQDLLPAADVTMISGDGGTGKSLLTLQLAVSVATGKAWIGRPILKTGPALYLSAEDDDAELQRRTAAICEAYGLDFGDLGQFMPRSFVGRDAFMALLDRGTNGLVATGLFQRLEDEIARHRPAFVGLDTLADLHTGDENTRAHARQFIGLIRRLSVKYGCGVALLAHPSLSGMASGSGMSGSTAWNGSVRSRLYFERITDKAEGGAYEADPAARKLSNKKSNYGPLGVEIGLRWQEGAFIADPSETALDRLTANAKAEWVFLKLLRELTAQGRNVNASTGKGYAPHMFATSGQAEGVSKRALAAAMESLFAKGLIHMVQYGPPSRDRKRIEEVEK